MRFVTLLVILPWLWQCDSSNETITTECAAALTAFTSSVQPSITASTCEQSGCHSSATDTSGFALLKDTDQASANRKELLHAIKAHNLFDADKLWDYLNGDHPGKEKLGDLNKADLSTWLMAEQKCE